MTLTVTVAALPDPPIWRQTAEYIERHRQAKSIVVPEQVQQDALIMVSLLFASPLAREAGEG